MSEFGSSDTKRWDKILKLHWDYLDTEEGMEKIKKCKELENCIKEFLYVVPHDRKFFLPETALVLKQSVRDVDNFTAYKANTGFKAISQYANNLFTKPWRKEFRILKTYSGFYQHEIESNLKNAEKLFEAMGYRRVSNEMMVLDGPICPDQVANVSRDAMVAYIECQIMKNIYGGLSTFGVKCTWQDIYSFREKFGGDASLAIKGLTYAVKERRERKENLISDSGYATVQRLAESLPAPPPPPPPAVVSQCLNCAPYHHNISKIDGFMQLPHQPCALHGNQSQMQSGCALHPNKVNLMCSCNNNKMYTSYPNASGHCHNHTHTQTQAGTAHMSHSRSLEHYNEPPPLLPHRHSFDHQQQGCSAHHQSHYHVPRPHAQYPPQHLYESPYDCIDGAPGDDSMDGSSVSYAAVAASKIPQSASAYAHSYNVSGNRYPLPYNISNQLNMHYATPTPVTCNGVKGLENYDEDDYATISKAEHLRNYNGNLKHTERLLSARDTGSKDFQNYRQRSFPPDQLIDFDDRALLTSHDYHAQQHLQSQKYYDYDRDRDRDRSYRGSLHQLDQRRMERMERSNGLNPNYSEPKDQLVSCQQRGGLTNVNTSSDDAYGSNVYARVVPRSSRNKDGAFLGQQNKQTTDKYLRKMEYMQGYADNNRTMPMELNGRCVERVNGGIRHKLSSQSNERDLFDPNYDSTMLDDFVTVSQSEHAQSSPTQAVKNQDGVGSYETWNYVFQNLDRSGYTKDLGERGDLLVQSLDLDSLNLKSGAENQNSTTDPRRMPAQSVELKSGLNTVKQVNGEKTKAIEKVYQTEKREPKQTVKLEKSNSILKSTNMSNGTSAGTGTSTGGKQKTKSALKASMSSSSTMVEHAKTNGNAIANGGRNVKRQISSGTGTMRSASGKQVPIATQVIVTAPNQWSCRFCTFLNSDTINICEMCHKSKDFNLEATVSNTPTCV